MLLSNLRSLSNTDIVPGFAWATSLSGELWQSEWEEAEWQVQGWSSRNPSPTSLFHLSISGALYPVLWACPTTWRKKWQMHYAALNMIQKKTTHGILDTLDMLDGVLSVKLTGFTGSYYVANNSLVWDWFPITTAHFLRVFGIGQSWEF